MLENQMFTLRFQGEVPADEIDVDLTAVFEHEDGERTLVKGFYAGEGRYEVRFLPQRTGKYRYKVSGLFTREGEEVCEASELRGVIHADGTAFRDAHGRYFHPFGTTVYALVHQEEALVDTTMKTLKAAPFNKVRLCVFPKYMDYNRSDPPMYPYAFKDGKPDVSRPDFAFWKMLERRLMEFNDMGIEADLILFHPYDKWGFSHMAKEDCFRYLDYALRRLCAFPNIWWSLANEYDVVFSYAGMFPEFAAYVAEHDPYSHLLSNHQMLSPWDFSEPHTTHVCLQTKDVVHTAHLMATYHKPVLYDEVQYEGNLPWDWGSITPELLVERFWRACASGAYCTHGETFADPEKGEDQVLWWGKGGELHGKSPARIAYLRKLIESLPGKLEPLTNELFFPNEATLEGCRKDAKAGKYSPWMTAIITHTLTKEGLLFLKAMPERNFGHIGEDVYLYYLADQCAAVFDITLPENKQYRVTVIDTWEMTETAAFESASGKVRVPLPGKTGMAILARKISS